MTRSLGKFVKVLATKSTSKKVVFGDVTKKESIIYERAMLCAFDFNCSSSDELSFRRGDILLVETPVSLSFVRATNNSSYSCKKSSIMTKAGENQWLRARDWRNGNVGLVPTNFLTDETGTSVVFDAFQCISRAEAEAQLLLPVIQSGTFIVRPTKDVGRLTLSVLVRENSSAYVQHYHINYDAASREYYLSSDEKWKSLGELIKFYCVLRNTIVFDDREYSVLPFDKCGVGLAPISAYSYWIMKVKMWRCRVDGRYGDDGMLATFFYTLKVLIGSVILLAQISDGMAYLERRRAVHNDLRAANILVDADNSVKVADFGLTKILHNDGRDICDISDDNDVITAVENGYRLCNPRELGYQCEDRIYAKMQACWNSNPEARPSFESLCDFFKPSDAAIS
ncbi:unnamed protein product [Hydatigera taeniaeformis]|uniref:Tyrosine-protein kinase n=1 Tax=Hydatigena taeniaeformis TaxID=6205 RepID=A0A0R3X584_HYDTA|nr:unnamed protein product [Hydatigera taeniaeformis]